MKTCNKCLQQKNLDLFYNFKHSKDGKQPWCKQCANANYAKYRKNMPENVKEKAYKRSKEWREQYYNSPAFKERQRIRREEHAIKMAPIKEARRLLSIEKQKQHHREFRRAHKERYAFYAARRYADKLKRTPKWLTEADWLQIEIIYEMAAEKTKSTGIKYVVDHIIPLKGKLISGLHVPSNLQIITARENSLKLNKWPYP
jgi:hypothetical protein